MDGTNHDTALPEMPVVFKPRRNQHRLDYRPVAWSLRNRPGEWQWRTLEITIEHIPSGHIFWIGADAIYLFDADCSCRPASRVRPTLADRIRLRRALRDWRKSQRITPEVNAQFAAHFIRPEPRG